MQSTFLLIQFVSQNIALLCCALFAGAAAYVSLVEQPTIVAGGTELTGAYLLLAQPRPVFFQTFFAAVGALAGIAAGVTGGAVLWLAGGIVLSFAVLFQLAVVLPATRRLFDADLIADPEKTSGVLRKLTRLHAMQSLAGLASLLMFILKT
jgi:hypothetical protein